MQCCRVKSCRVKSHVHLAPIAALLLGCWAFSTGCRGGHLAEAPQSFEEFRQRLESRVERGLKKYRIPGAALALVHEGSVVAERGFGVVRRGETAAVESTTVFQVASVSKPVTAVGVLQLAEEGVLDLDRPVSSYLRRWHFPDRHRPDAGLSSEGVTARRLLSHTAGVSIHGYPGFAPELSLPSLEDSLNGATGGAGRVLVELPPGSSVAYSGGGYTVLQLLVEELTGQSFASYMKSRVLQPLGMRGSGYDLPLANTDLASGHGWWGAALPSYRFRAQAASGLYATAGDLGRFLAGVGRPSRVGLSAETRDQMLQPLEGRQSGFGLGFAFESLGAERIVLHTGANRGWRSIVAATPDMREGVVLLTNSDRGLALTTDVLCWWGQWLSGQEPATCWAERKSRGTILAVAMLVAIGMLIDGSGFVAGLLAGRGVRHRGRLERYRWLRHRWLRHRWLNVPRLVLSVVVLGLWWSFWYSDVIVVQREGIENFTPVASLPPTFSWLTGAVTLWCVSSITRSLVGRRRHRGEGAQHQGLIDGA